MADTNYNKEYVFFKDITPIIVESDRSSGSGFTNLNRLTTILHSWGFSDVNVSNVTEWKISGKNQYPNHGPRLEWKGNLFVKAPGLDSLKCKNKDKTSFQTCTDIQEDNYILLNTHASSYSGAAWKWIHISEFGFAMCQDKCYLLSGNRFLNNVTDFMRNPIEDDVDKIVVHEGYYDWKHYSVPFYKINNVLLNAWGDPVSTKTSEKYCFKNHTIYSSYSNENKKPDKFLFEKIVVKTPWVVSNYFGASYSSEIVNDYFTRKNNHYYHINKSTNNQTEIILTENTKVLLYYRVPGTMSLESAPTLAADFSFDAGIPSSSASIYFPKQTINMSLKVLSEPTYKIYDLTDAIRAQKTFTLFESSFNNLVNNNTIQLLNENSSNYNIFNRYWKPIKYIFPERELKLEKKTEKPAHLTLSITAHKDFSLTGKLNIDDYSGYWIPTEEDSSVTEIELTTSATALAELRGSRTGYYNFNAYGSVECYFYIHGKSMPFSSFRSYKPSSTFDFYGGSSSIIDFSKGKLTETLGNNYLYWSYSQTATWREGGGSVDTTTYNGQASMQYFIGYVAGDEAYARNDHYAIVVWDMDRFETKKGSFNISTLVDGGDLYITFENYSNKDVEITSSLKSNPFTVLSYQTYTYKTGNIGETIHWAPDAHIKYTDPKTNQEVKIYLKDI